MGCSRTAALGPGPGVRNCLRIAPADDRLLQLRLHRPWEDSCGFAMACIESASEASHA
jgi:hypothetical protein